MGKSLEKLLSISSGGLSPQIAHSESFGCYGQIGTDLGRLLKQKNGFQCFMSALHVYPACTDSTPNLDAWNTIELWKSRYQYLPEGYLFFGQDIFGCQFCTNGSEVSSFDPETAELTFISSSLEGWAQKVLEDYEYLTGFPLAEEWQQKNGGLGEGDRLLPKVPFVTGGDYSISNLYVMDSVSGMRYRASIANQIHDLPEGAVVKLEVK